MIEFFKHLKPEDKIEIIGLVISFIGILLTAAFSIMNYLFNKKKVKKEDYINNVSAYRLKYLDLVREPIAEYLESLDRLIRCKKQDIGEAFDNYRKKHYQILSFMTLFSEVDKKITQKLDSIFAYVSLDSLNGTAENRTNIRKILVVDLQDVDSLLRGKMDEDWGKMKNEIGGDKVKKANQKQVAGKH